MVFIWKKGLNICFVSKYAFVKCLNNFNIITKKTLLKQIIIPVCLYSNDIYNRGQNISRQSISTPFPPITMLKWDEK